MKSTGQTTRTALVGLCDRSAEPPAVEWSILKDRPAHRCSDDSFVKNSAGVAIRRPVRCATVCVKCLVSLLKSQSGFAAIADSSKGTSVSTEDNLPAWSKRFSSTSSWTASPSTSRQIPAAQRESTALSSPHGERIPPVRTFESRNNRSLRVPVTSRDASERVVGGVRLPSNRSYRNDVQRFA